MLGFVIHDTRSDGCDQIGMVGPIEAEHRFEDAGLVTSVLVMRIEAVVYELGWLDDRYARILQDRHHDWWDSSAELPRPWSRTACAAPP
jgi:hypothetical protein